METLFLLQSDLDPRTQTVTKYSKEWRIAPTDLTFGGNRVRIQWCDVKLLNTSPSMYLDTPQTKQNIIKVLEYILQNIKSIATAVDMALW